MNRSEELRAKLRAMFVKMWAAKPPEERRRLMAQLPQYQRDGVARMIENHHEEQK